MADKRFVAKNGLDNNSQTITNVADPQNAQDAATKAFSSNADNLTSGTVNAARLPAAPDFGTVTADAIQFDTANPAPVTAIGQFTWNNDDGTLDLGLKGGNVTLQLGQQEFVRIVNPTATTLTKGQVVYVAGAQGSRVRVQLAQANMESTSAETIGVVMESIPPAGEGFIITAGLLRHIDTSAFAEGALLWLSAATPGAITATRPTAPNHGVQIGYVVRSHASTGIIFIHVQNGYELEELHDVLIVSPATGDLLRWDGSRWVNEAPTALNTGSKVVVRDASGNFAAGTITATLSGNASTATAWATGRTISLTGDVTGTSAAFDGTANLSFAATLAASGVTAGTYGSSTAVPVVTIDTKGRVTSVTTASISGSLAFTGDVTGTGTTGTSTTLTLANTGVAAGTYTKVTVDAKGRVTSATTLASGDLPTYTGTLTSGQVTTALTFTPENAANKAQANGYASLDAGGKVPAAQLPSYVDDVLESANLAAFPGTGETGKIYVTLDTNKVYRWSGSAYVEISPSPGSTDAVTEGSTNLYFTTARARSSISAAGSLSYNSSTGVISYTQPTNISTFTNDSGYITSATAAATYLPLAGGTVTGDVTISGSETRAIKFVLPSSYNSTGTYNNLIERINFPWYSESWDIGIRRGGGVDIQSMEWWLNGTTKVMELTRNGALNAVGAITQNGNQVLHAGNYTSYSPSLTGTGASGTWGINITGNAATATSATDSTKLPLSGGSLSGQLVLNQNIATPSNYYNGLQLEVRATSGTAGIGLHRSGYSHVGIYHDESNVLKFNMNGGTVTMNATIGTLIGSGNYNSYSPTLTGGGASGTWGINISGNAATASYAAYADYSTYYFNQNLDLNAVNIGNRFGAYNAYYPSGGSYNQPIGGGQHFRVIQFGGYAGGAGESNIWRGQIAQSFYDDQMWFRKEYSTTWGSWREFLHSGNYNSYSPTLTGTGASGTWGINISGTAGSISGYNNPTTAATANTIAYRNSLGDIAVRELVLEVAVQDFTPSSMVAIYPTTNQAVKVTAGGARNFLDVPTRSGGNASGTWGINITGNAATITSQANSATITASTGVDANNIVRRDGNGYIYANHINFNTTESENPAINSFITSNGDGWSRKSTKAHVISQLGVMHYAGINSGNWNNFTDSAGELRIDEVADINGGAHSNQPPNVYTYGAVMSWRTAAHSFQLYASHTGDLTFKTQWYLDGYSGWRRILHESNYNGWAPSLTGAGASGTWGISISGGLTATAPNLGSSVSGQDISYGTQGGPQVLSAGGGAAMMSFHRPGLYAINFGLGSDNQLRTGGWSRGGNHVILDSGNYSSYAPTLVGGGASGTWGINVSGYSTYFPTNYIGGQQLNPQTYFGPGVGLRVAMTAAVGYWTDTLWINGYSGGDVPSMIALHTSRLGTPRMWISAQNSDATSYGTTYEFLSTYNYSSYALPLSGGTITGNGAALNLSGNASRITVKSENQSWQGVLGYVSNTGTISFPGSNIEISGGWNSTITLSTGTTGYNSGSVYIPWGTVNSRSGYISTSNPWGTSDSAFFPNGITTAGGTNWVYGTTYLGNAPGNGSGCQVSSNGRFYNEISSGTAMQVVRTGSAGNATDSYTALFEQTYGNHSWGIVAEYRIGNSGGSDRPSILFSTAYNTNTWSVGFGSGSGDSNFRINRDHGHRNSSWGTTLMVMDRSGNVTFSGDVTAYSDIRLKQNITGIEAALEKVQKLRGVTFNRIDSEDTARRHAGVIAQEVETVLPEVVSEDDKGNKHVAYGNMVGLLIEAIKEQQAEIAALRDEVRAMRGA